MTSRPSPLVSGLMGVQTRDDKGEPLPTPVDSSWGATAGWLGKLLLVPFIQGIMVGAGTTLGQHIATNLLKRRAASTPS